MSASDNLDLWQASLSGNASDAKREKILDAALSLFIEFGLRRNTMEDVANRAGVGRATVYRRFGDKDSLIQAVILRECQRNLVLIEQKVAQIDNPLDSLLESFVLATTMAHRHPLLERLLQAEPEPILPHLTVSMGPLLAFSRHYLAQRIDAAEQEGMMAKRGAQSTAEMILRLLQSLILSPDGGVIDPADEASVRRFSESHLRPLLQPQG